MGIANRGGLQAPQQRQVLGIGQFLDQRHAIVRLGDYFLDLEMNVVRQELIEQVARSAPSTTCRVNIVQQNVTAATHEGIKRHEVIEATTHRVIAVDEQEIDLALMILAQSSREALRTHGVQGDHGLHTGARQ